MLFFPFSETTPESELEAEIGDIKNLFKSHVQGWHKRGLKSDVKNKGKNTKYEPEKSPTGRSEWRGLKTALNTLI